MSVGLRTKKEGERRGRSCGNDAGIISVLREGSGTIAAADDVPKRREREGLDTGTEGVWLPEESRTGGRSVTERI